MRFVRVLRAAAFTPALLPASLSFRAGRRSHGQVGEMLGLGYWQTEAFLNDRGVPVNYSAADLDADNATLDKILARC